MTQEANQLIQDYVRVWDVTAPDDLAQRIFARDVVDHNPQPGQGPGVAGIEQIIAVYHGAFPDLHLSCDDIVGSNDRVAVRWSATGTHEGDQLGVPPTHRTVRLTGIDIVRIENGRIVERWGEANGLEMMAQITAS
jgi:predicted ester cyclase